MTLLRASWIGFIPVTLLEWLFVIKLYKKTEVRHTRQCRSDLQFSGRANTMCQETSWLVWSQGASKTQITNVQIYWNTALWTATWSILISPKKCLRWECCSAVKAVNTRMDFCLKQSDLLHTPNTEKMTKQLMFNKLKKKLVLFSICFPSQQTRPPKYTTHRDNRRV